MAALLEQDLLGAAPLAPTSDKGADLAAQAAQHSRTGDAIKSAMPELVKGAGFASKGGNQPLTDPAKVTVLASQAALDLRTEVRRGYTAKADVVKGMSGDFMGQFGALRTALMTPSIGEQIAQLMSNLPGGADALAKSFTAGNLGIGSVSGFVP
jgi:hypothetical protein